MNTFKDWKDCEAPIPIEDKDPQCRKEEAQDVILIQHLVLQICLPPPLLLEPVSPSSQDGWGGSRGCLAPWLWPRWPGRPGWPGWLLTLSTGNVGRRREMESCVLVRAPRVPLPIRLLVLQPQPPPAPATTRHTSHQPQTPATSPSQQPATPASSTLGAPVSLHLTCSSVTHGNVGHVPMSASVGTKYHQSPSHPVITRLPRVSQGQPGFLASPRQPGSLGLARPLSLP